MKPILWLGSLLISVPLATSQLVIPLDAPYPGSRPFRRPPPGQLPVMPPSPPYAAGGAKAVTPPLPPAGGVGGGAGRNDNTDGPTTEQPSVSLSDILGTHRSLTTFFSLARQSESTSILLSDMSARATVLAPLNSAVEALPRKPWEDPRALVSSYEGDEGQDRAKKNLDKFVQAHMLMATPWKEGEKVQPLVGGREIWWEKKSDGQMVIMPDGVVVDKIASKVANGEVWILKGVLNYL